MTIVCRQLARPQLGLKLRTLAFLDIPRIELMSRKFSISSGLIVGEVHLSDLALYLSICYAVMKM
jgi:hypothetical protein